MGTTLHLDIGKDALDAVRRDAGPGSQNSRYARLDGCRVQTRMPREGSEFCPAQCDDVSGCVLCFGGGVVASAGCTVVARTCTAAIGFWAETRLARADAH